MGRPGTNGRRPTRIVTERGTAGKLDPNLEMFGQIGPQYYQMYLFPEEYTVEGPDGPQRMTHEKGPTVRLVVTRKLILELTNMTHEELMALYKFFTTAFELAEPVVLARDKEAQDAYDSGSDVFTRLHRAVPHVVARPRAKRAHGEVVRIGPQGLLARGWDGLNRIFGFGDRGDAVADEHQSGGQSQDDRA